MPNLFFNDANGYYEQGKLAVTEQRLDDALEAFRTSVELEPTVDALIGLGMVAMMVGNEDEGLGALERAYELSPEDERVIVALGSAYITLGEYEAAIDVVQPHVANNPMHTEGHLLLFEAYAGMGESRQAEKEMRQALKLAPDDPDVHLAASRYWMLEGKMTKALKEAQQAVQLAPEEPQTHYMLGTVLTAQERFAEALQENQIMLDADPAFPPARISKGIILYQLGQRDEGLALLKQVRQDYPDDPSILHSIAISYFSLNLLTEAKEVLQQEIELDPDFPDAHALLFQVASVQGDEATMQEAYQGLLSTDDLMVMDALEQALMEMRAEDAKEKAGKDAKRAGKKKRGPVQAIYQLKITLKRLRPPVWRRVLVPDTITLADLHKIIQAAMGWYGGHLHEFEAGYTHYGIPDPDDRWYGLHKEDERTAAFTDIAEDVKRLKYTYDFGDNWEHEILIEKVLPPDPEQTYPVCVKCVRACPPEDIGGVWGYAEFLEAIADPSHESHEEMLEWIGGSFDPEACDLETINARLASIKL